MVLVYFTLRSAFSTISTEREKLKQMLEHDASSSPSAQIVGLKNALTSVSDMLKFSKLHCHQILLLNFIVVNFCFFIVCSVLEFAVLNHSKLLHMVFFKDSFLNVKGIVKSLRFDKLI